MSRRNWMIERWAVCVMSLTLSWGLSAASATADEPVRPAELKVPGDADPHAKTDGAKASEDDADEPKDATDLYAAPQNGTTEELLEFIEHVRNYRPRNIQEYFDHQKKAGEALRKAAELLLKKDDLTDQQRKDAEYLLLQARVDSLGDADEAARKEIIEQVAAYLSGSEKIGRQQQGLAMAAARSLERANQPQAAADAYKTFAPIFKNSTDPDMADYGTMMEGAARRVMLLGKEMKVDGPMLDGTALDWNSYRGKVVLVDFWATWCGPCIGELPNVKKMYEAYHDKGFDVVGISLDTDRDRLEKFIEKEEIPWVTVYEDGSGWKNSNAQYYGVMAIPTVILVDRDGKVVSLNARGEELGTQLEKLIGPSSQTTSDQPEK